MSSISKAGYNSKAQSSHQKSVFDDLPQEDNRTNPEQQQQLDEQQIKLYIVQASQALASGSPQNAISLLQTAMSQEQKFRKYCQQNQLQYNEMLSNALKLKLAEVFTQLRQYDGAIMNYEKVLQTVKGQQAAQIRLKIGKIYLQQHNHSTALKEFRKGLDLPPPEYQRLKEEISVELCGCLLEELEYEKAVEFLKSVDVSSNSIENENIAQTSKYRFLLRFQLIYCYICLKNTKQAWKEYVQIVKDIKLSLEDETYQDRQLLESSLFNLATLLKNTVGINILAGFDKIINLMKENQMIQLSQRIMMQKALFQLNKGDIASARETLEGVTSSIIDPQLTGELSGGNVCQYSIFHSNLSFLHILQKNYEAALKEAQQGVKIDDTDSGALVNLGISQFYLKNDDAALDSFQKASANNSDCMQAVYNQGLVYYNKQDYQAALQQFQRVLNRCPSNIDSLYMIADCQFKLKNYEASLQQLNLIIRKLGQNASDPGVYAKMAEIYQILANEASAAHYMKEAYRLNSCNLDYIKWLASYYLKQELYEQCRLVLEKASEVDYQNTIYEIQQAQCLRKSGQYKEAAKLLERTLTKEPQNISALKLLIRTYDQLKEHEKAVQVQQRLDKLQSNADSLNTNQQQEQVGFMPEATQKQLNEKTQKVGEIDWNDDNGDIVIDLLGDEQDQQDQ